MNPAKFASLRLIHTALLIGQIALIGVAYALRLEPSIAGGESLREMLTIMAVVYFLALLGGRFIFRMMLQKALSQSTEEQKFNSYQAAFMIRWGLLEAASIMGSVFFIFTGEQFFLLFSGLLALVFLADRPTAGRATRELRL